MKANSQDARTYSMRLVEESERLRAESRELQQTMRLLTQQLRLARSEARKLSKLLNPRLKS